MARHRWSDADDRRLLEYVAAHGGDRSALAAHMGLPYLTIVGRIDRALRVRHRKALAAYEARMAAQREVAPVNTRANAFPLDVPVRPFAVPLPAVAPSRQGKPLRAVVYGDTHYPFQDDKALTVLKAVIRDVKPHVVVHIGDLVDCWQISRFDKDPARSDSLQQNIDAARTHLHEIAQLAPKATRVWLEGNHENRLTRAIWKMDGAQRELARLRVFQQAMTWPVLMDTAGMGWEFIGERDQSKRQILPKIITKHGTIVRKFSGYTARAEWEKYGASGISGHTHRLGMFFHRDHNGTARWMESGCTCLLDPPYGSDFDWQQGFVVLAWNADRRLMDTQMISIRDGSALYHEREYGQR